MSAGAAGGRPDRGYANLHGDGWAILALPPGRRDLGCPELWERSLARSLRRREAAAARRPAVSRGTGALVSAALLTAAVVVPAVQVARAQDPRRPERPAARICARAAAARRSPPPSAPSASARTACSGRKP